MYVLHDGINEVLSGIRTQRTELSSRSLRQQEQTKATGESAVNWEKNLKDMIMILQAELPQFMRYSVYICSYEHVYWIIHTEQHP